MTWGPWRLDNDPCCDQALELVDATQTPGHGSDEALTVPASPSDLILGPYDSIAPNAISGATDIGGRPVLSGWFANAGIVNGTDVVSVTIEEIGASGVGSGGYMGADQLYVISGLTAHPVPFTYALRGRGCQFRLRSNDAVNAARIAAQIVARQAGAIQGEGWNYADRYHSRPYGKIVPYAVAASATELSPVMMVQDRHSSAAMRTPVGGIPEGLLVAPTADVNWVIKMDAASSGARLELRGSFNATMANEVTFLDLDVSAGGTFGSGAGIVTLLGGAGAFQLPDLESPFPFWRMVFTNGATAQAAFQWTIRGGGG